MLWYAAYGSNVDPDRFAYYLAGGAPPGARRAVPGARDATPPREERPVVLRGAMFFGWASPTWGGGISFFDADADAGGTAYARAYLLSEGQFADVAAQEMHREPGRDLDLSHVLAHRRHEVGPGRYETLHLVGEIDGLPVLTFTADRPDGLVRNAPSPAYLRIVARGIARTHDLAEDDLVGYLAGCAGMGEWDAAELRALVREAVRTG